MDNNTIGRNIKIERKRKGFSQERLAEMIGVSRQTIVNWENGKGMPILENIEEMCKVFNVSYEELTGKVYIKDESTQSDKNSAVEADKDESSFLNVSQKTKTHSVVLLSILGIIAFVALTVFVVLIIIMVPIGSYDIRTFAFSFGFGENDILLIILILSLVIFLTTISLIIKKIIRSKNGKE